MLSACDSEGPTGAGSGCGARGSALRSRGRRVGLTPGPGLWLWWVTLGGYVGDILLAARCPPASGFPVPVSWYHRPGRRVEFKLRTCNLSQLWRSEVQNQGVGGAVLP